MPIPTRERPEGFAEVDTGARPQLLETEPSEDAGPEPTPITRPALSVAELDVLRKSLPAFENELILEDLEATPRSRVATMSICIAKPLTQATSFVVNELRDGGWEALRVTTPSNQSDGRRLSANSERFRLTATAEGGTSVGCPKPETHTKISMRFAERAPAPLKSSTYELDTRVPTKTLRPQRDEAARRREPSSESLPPSPRD